jgi:general secretion pathway protein D
MLGASIDFLVANSVAKVVSEPSIISINNKESSISVGETRSIITSSSRTSTAVNNSYKREDIGLNLKIKPRIANDKKVTLSVTVKLEDIVEGTGGTGTPTTTKREIKTTAIVKHGESVIIGGLVKRKKTQAVGGISFLSNIPLIGPLFGKHTDGMDNVNLVIIMTPYIIDANSSLTELRSNLAELDSMRKKYLETIKERLENFQEDFTLEDTN